MAYCNAFQETAKKKQKNHAPTYWPVVRGEKLVENMLSIVLSLLKVIMVLILVMLPIPPVSMGVEEEEDNAEAILLLNDNN